LLNAIIDYSLTMNPVREATRVWRPAAGVDACPTSDPT
jgi:hypothetical protein